MAENGEEVAYLKFHTGVPHAASPDEAAFALIDFEADALDLSSFRQGAPEYPDRSTTIVAQTRSLTRRSAMRISGPGVRGAAEIEFKSMPHDFLSQWQANHSTFFVKTAGLKTTTDTSEATIIQTRHGCPRRR